MNNCNCKYDPSPWTPLQATITHVLTFWFLVWFCGSGGCTYLREKIEEHQAEKVTAKQVKIQAENELVEKALNK